MEEAIKKYNLIFIVLIMAVAIFLRFYDLKTAPPGLYSDEAMNGANTLEVIEAPGGLWKNIKAFFPDNNGREGLFIDIQAIAVKYLGNEAWVLRLVSAIFGSLTVWGLYLLTKELFNKESVALLASLFLATSFWHINFSRIGFRAIMAPFFLCWGLWLVFVLRRKPNWLLGLFSGFVFSLGFNSYISYRMAPLLLIFPLWPLLKNKKILALVFFVIGVCLAVYPLANYYFAHPQDFLGRTSQISIFSAASPILELAKNIIITIGMFLVVGDFNWRHNIAGNPELWWPMAILFLIGIIISVKKIRKKEEPVASYWLLVTWLVIMLLPVVISDEGLPHALRSIVVAPVAMIFAALGSVWLIEKISAWLKTQKEKYPEKIRQLSRIKFELNVLLFAFLIVFCINTYKQYFWDWAARPEVASSFNKDMADLGNYLNRAPIGIKKYVIANSDGDSQILPMQTLPIMFLSDTYLKQKQDEKDIYYILPKDIDNFIKEANSERSIQIFMMKNDPQLRKKLSEAIPGLFTYTDQNVLIQQRYRE
ncbi:MAG: hypothetical protein Athens071424_199 [Parcubacteria group bacterium Athens0714_24]|nr:MAG: hypothetical protein Athens071424_199 [Parcubacteria group bacterium Athens0714_24]